MTARRATSALPIRLTPAWMQDYVSIYVGPGANRIEDLGMFIGIGKRECPGQGEYRHRLIIAVSLYFPRMWFLNDLSMPWEVSAANWTGRRWEWVWPRRILSLSAWRIE